MEELHSDALKLYKDYLDKDSYNFINCPSNIFNEFSYLMKEYHSIEKLTKLSRLLYKAYDHTFSALEEVWLPQFFHSSEVRQFFYIYLHNYHSNFFSFMLIFVEQKLYHHTVNNQLSMYL